jgi:hypothetical protein
VPRLTTPTARKANGDRHCKVRYDQYALGSNQKKALALIAEEPFTTLDEIRDELENGELARAQLVMSKLVLRGLVKEPSQHSYVITPFGENHLDAPLRPHGR